MCRRQAGLRSPTSGIFDAIPTKFGGEIRELGGLCVILHPYGI